MKTFARLSLFAAIALAAVCPAVAQSAPAPGTGSIGAPGSFNPGPPPPPQGPAWVGGPMFVSTPLSTPYWQNNGQINVMGCGYDAEGIWRVVPMTVGYVYNGINYQVTVLNAYNPWTNMWNYGIDMPAYSTYYYLRGTYFNYYAPLSTGTYYFNL